MSVRGGRKFSLVASLALSFFGVGLGVARADSTEVKTCGEVLDKPGDYHLAQDLGPCAGHGVLITASDVRFTLGGHTLSGVSTQESCDIDYPQTGITIIGASGVRVSGGTVRGFVDGIGHYGTNSVVAGMTVADNCVFGVLVQGTGNRVETSRVSGSDDGIALCESRDAVVTGNEAFGNFHLGVMLSCTGTDHNHIVTNVMHDNGLPAGGGGVAIYNGDWNEVLGNAITGNWDGIWLSATTQSVVRENTVNANLHLGISASGFSPTNTLEANTAFANGLADLSEENACLVNTWLNNHFGTGIGCVS
jgi:parallel beta-helix repeat protein